MSRIISLVLVCDGTSDRCIIDVATWLMRTRFPDLAYRIVSADEVIPAKGPLQGRLQRTMKLYRADAILCHRDAEAFPSARRIAEVDSAAEHLGVPVIPVVPVRMIEAWLLTDEAAIRSAASNRNGKAALGLPGLDKLEAIPDPKAFLLAALRAASELPPRRLRKFNELQARSRVSSYIDDFSPLRALAAFVAFESRFADAMNRLSE